MITKIFYSLVLFPGITYETIILGYGIFDIVESGYGTIRVTFKKENTLTFIEFIHKDYLPEGTPLLSKNWWLSGVDCELLRAVHEKISITDQFDFNFFKPKDFYRKIPFWTVLNITSKCNLFCDYCFNDYDYALDTRNTRKTLWLEDLKKIIDILYEAGTRDIILTWWEPFSYPFLWDILDHLGKRNIFTRINTNGTLLFDQTLSRLNKNYSVHFMVSVHEFNNKDYYDLNKKWASNIYKIDELKKWETKYDDKISQLKKVQSYKNLSLWFLTILTPKNIIYLEKIFEYMLSNFSIDDWHFFRLFSTGTTKWISREMIILGIHKLYKLNKKYKKTYKIVDAVPFCVTKNTDIASDVIDGELSENHNVKTIITAEWNIQIMSAFDIHLWNILPDGIQKIWEWEFVQKKLTNWFLPKDCYDCKHKNECMWWSRMNANIYNGSYDALDPLCNLNNKPTHG